jgi:L-malate glycosyltransferase
MSPDREAATLRLLVLADASSIHTEQWVRGLAASGPVELHLVTMNPAGVRPGLRDAAGLVAIHEIRAGSVKAGGGNWRYVLNVPRVRRIARRLKPDAIVAIYLSSYGVMAAALKGRAVLAHVILGSDVMLTPDRSSFYRAIAGWALDRGDLVVSVSRAATAKVRALSRVPSQAILTQQYGLEDWVLDYAAAPKTYAFVSNRAWVPNSRIPQVLQIFRLLVNAQSLALIGAGPQVDVDSQIRDQASRDPRVHVLGALPYRENVDVLAQSAFYISMTASDGASLSLMEAMAVGAIPVVSDIEPNREWIEDGRNGVLLPTDDVATAAARIEALLARPVHELDEIRRRNREVVRQRGSRSRNMEKFRHRLEDAVAKHGRLVS